MALQYMANINWEMLIFCAIGALTLWGRLSVTQARKFAFSRLVDGFFTAPRSKLAAEIAIFVILGAIVSYMIAEPQTCRQAFAAGMGWTSMLQKS